MKDALAEPMPGLRFRRPPLAGRSDELEHLVAAVSRPPAVVTLIGEEGIGKTRMVEELLAHEVVSGRRVLIGRCHGMRDPFPLGPMLAALRGFADDPPARAASPLVGVLRPLLPELARHLPARPEPLPSRVAERHRVFRAIGALLDAGGPALCILEDLHNADPETLELLPFLVAEPSATLSLVLTWRREDLTPASPLPRLAAGAPAGASAAEIELAPLSTDDVATMGATLLGSERLPADLAGHLRDHTGGIPFAVREVLLMLSDRGTGPQGIEAAISGLDELSAPGAIRDAVGRRLALLGGDARRVAQAAAVLQAPADEELLGKIAGLSLARARRALVEALSGGLLAESPGRGCGFRCPLAARAAREDIPRPARRELHRRAARALEAARDPWPLAAIAHHFNEGGQRRRSVRYAEAAAEAAHGAGDDKTAARLLEEALQVPGLSRAARVRMALALGRAALYSPSPQAAIAALERALAEGSALSAGVRGELRFSALRLRTRLGRTDGWWEEMLQAIDELGRRPELAVRAMINLALVRPWLSTGGVAEHLRWLERAGQLASGVDDPVVSVAVASQRAAILLSVGDRSGWDALDAIPAATTGSVDERLQLLRGYHSCSHSALRLGYHGRADTLLARAERIQAELGHSWSELWLGSTRVALDWAQGRWQELGSRTRELAERRRDALALDLQLVAASLQLRRGQVEHARIGAEAIREAARREGCFGPLASAAALLAEIELAAGEAQAACATVGEAMDKLRPGALSLGARTLAPVAVEALLACGRRLPAEQFTAWFAAGMRGRDAPAARAALASCRGQLAEHDADGDGADRAFARSERMWAQLPSPYEAALARERRGRSLLRRGEERGGELLLAAHETAHRLGASWDADRIRAELRTEGLAPPARWRGGRRGYGEQLSPREVEVARLAAAGRTNREIAQALVISPHTAAHHVSAALRKLGLTSRHALAAGGLGQKDG